MSRNQKDENLIVPTTDGIISMGNSLKSLFAANGTNTVTISNVAPAGVGTATISKWLLINHDGVDFYIPCWT